MCDATGHWRDLLKGKSLHLARKVDLSKWEISHTLNTLQHKLTEWKMYASSLSIRNDIDGRGEVSRLNVIVNWNGSADHGHNVSVSSWNGVGLPYLVIVVLVEMPLLSVATDLWLSYLSNANFVATDLWLSYLSNANSVATDLWLSYLSNANSNCCVHRGWNSYTEFRRFKIKGKYPS